MTTANYAKEKRVLQAKARTLWFRRARSAIHFVFAFFAFFAVATALSAMKRFRVHPIPVPNRACIAGLILLLMIFHNRARGESSGFINFENPHVHPMDLSPNGLLLAICNTPDHSIELFDLAGDLPRPLGSIPVGMEPVTVRFRTDGELWTANHISDSVSIVDLGRSCVVRTLATSDEPSDIVFAGNPARAFVSCSQADTVMVFDPARLDRPPELVKIQGQRPRSMAASSDGKTLYVAVFESGNATTLLGGGSEEAFGRPFPPNVVNDRRGPYGDLSRVNPPPNRGVEFYPPLNPTNPPPPKSGLIVRKSREGRWLDDNGKDWSRFVSGDLAPSSGRVAGWDVIDHDVAVVDTATLAVSYAGGLMNICMSLAVNPATGQVTVIGTDARNEVRFEPVLNGVFLRVQMGVLDPAPTLTTRVVDLNPHLTYTTSNIPNGLRNRSLGDPRGVAWTRDGKRGLVIGMGSNNLILIDPQGARVGKGAIEVGEGPTGVVIDEPRQRVYVLNRFESSISVVGLDSESEIGRVPMFDPTPERVRKGRKHLYNTHRGSGLGHIACASCHVDARIDRLAWDLGEPGGEMKTTKGNNLGAGIVGLVEGYADYHPMKGPMTTQTLQDIIGKEPFHWRADRKSLEDFNETFKSLQGADTLLTTTEMAEFKDFLASLYFPPNPYRNLDNTLPSRLPLPGHYTTGRFGPAGRPLLPGDARVGLAIFQNVSRRIDRQAFACITCHALPSGLGTDATLVRGSNRTPTSSFTALPAGPLGEHHHALVGINFSVQHGFKVPQLRNLYKKTGCEMTQKASMAGFGFMHDGGVDSLARFVGLDVFDVASDSEVSHLVAFLLSFSGSDFERSGRPLSPESVIPPVLPAKIPTPPSADKSRCPESRQVSICWDNSSLWPRQAPWTWWPTRLSIALLADGSICQEREQGFCPIKRGNLHPLRT